MTPGWLVLALLVVPAVGRPVGAFAGGPHVGPGGGELPAVSSDAAGASRIHRRLVPCRLPVIVTQPASCEVTPGQGFASQVVATGTGSLAYQWYQGDSGDTSTPIQGATSPSYGTIAPSATTSYWVRVSDRCGSTASATATVTVVQVRWTTLAGETAGNEDGPGSQARFAFQQSGVALDAAGTVYVGDSLNRRVRAIAPDGTVATLSGTVLGMLDGPGRLAQFQYPSPLSRIDPVVLGWSVPGFEQQLRDGFSGIAVIRAVGAFGLRP